MLNSITAKSYILPSGIENQDDYLNWLEMNGYGYLESVMKYVDKEYANDWTRMGESIFTEPSDNADHDGEIYKWIKEVCFSNNKSILDVGSNVGYLSIALANRKVFSRVVGIDASMLLVGYARMLCCKYGVKNIRFDHGNALSMSYKNKEFDVVYSQHVLEHLPSIYEALKEQKRVGKIVCGFVPHEEKTENAQHIYTFTEKSLGNIMGLLFSKWELKISEDKVILGYIGYDE